MSDRLNIDMGNFDADFLKSMRKEAGFTQLALAQRLGISRETVIGIERKNAGTIETLSLKTTKKWIKVCRSGTSATTRKTIQDYIINFFDLNV